MRYWLTLISSCLIFASYSHLAAQQPQPAVPENTLNSTDTIGLPDAASKEGTAEVVNLNAGNLTMFLPVLTLPQRAGAAPLVLGFTYDSNQINLQTTSSDEIGSIADGACPGSFCPYDTFSYTVQNGQTTLAHGPLDLNLPQLTASLEYEGDWFDPDALETEPNAAIGPRYCLTNVTFKDWKGTIHAFPAAIPVCDIEEPYDGAAALVPTDNSEDNQFYRFDGTNRADFIVYAPDGTAYHFANPRTPCGDASFGLNCPQSGSMEQFLQTPMTSSVDRYGNTMTYSFSTSTLTDTLGRKIVFNDYVQDDDGITINYADSNGAFQQISMMGAPDAIAAGKMTATDLTIPQASGYDVGPYLTSNSCALVYDPGPPPNPQYDPLWIEAAPDGWTPPEQTSSRQFTGYALYSTATGKITKMLFDSFGHLLKITYPEGGYHRYDYALTSAYPVWSGPAHCDAQSIAEVAHRYECSDISGSCSHEAVTTYSGTTDGILPVSPCTNSQGTGWGQFNTQEVVTDPDGSITVHCFQAPYLYFPTVSVPLTPLLETNTYKYSSSGTLLRKIHTGYDSCNAIYTQCTGTTYPFPTQKTTTLNDITPTLTSSETYSYDLLPSSIDPPYPGDSRGGGDRHDSNVIGEVLYGYDGNPMVNSGTWSYYAVLPNGAPLINELAGSGEYDYAKGKLLTETLTHDPTTGFVTQYEETDADVQTDFPGTFDLVWHYTPDAWGRPTAIEDPDGHTTHYGYQDNWVTNANTCLLASGSFAAPSNSSSYVTSVTNMANETTSYQYNYCSGLLASSTDANSVAVNLQYDGDSRITHRYIYDGSTLAGQLDVAYQDGPGSTITRTLLASPDPSRTTTFGLDGLGRVYDKSTSDSAGDIHVTTYFDPEGEVEAVTNPYRTQSDPTYALTSYLYDALGRRTFQCQPDNGGVNKVLPCDPSPSTSPSVLKSVYSGNVTTNYDETGREWQATADALGRLTNVSELGSTSQPLNLQTAYAYDGFGNLLTVNQNGQSGDTPRQQRTFSYDALSRLTNSFNPETGAIDYNYTQSGGGLCAGDPTLLCRKTDARSVTTTFGYDNLNRILTKAFSGSGSTATAIAAATPSSCYQYGTTGSGRASSHLVGRLIAEWTQTGTCPSQLPSSGYLTSKSILSYDAMGRIKSEQQCASSSCGAPFALAYSYDLAGNLTQADNGLGTIVWQPTYDMAGHLQAVGVTTPWTGPQFPSQLFNATGYSAVGLTNWTVGETPAGGSAPALNFTKSYDNRLRTTGETVTGNH